MDMECKLNECVVFGYTENGLTVDLKGGGVIKYHADILAGVHINDLFMGDVLTFKNTGEHHERVQFSGTVHDHYG